MQLQYVLHMGHLNVDYSLSFTHTYVYLYERNGLIGGPSLCYMQYMERKRQKWPHRSIVFSIAFLHGWCTHLMCFALAIHNIEWHRTIATGKCVHAFLTSLQLCENKLNMGIWTVRLLLERFLTLYSFCTRSLCKLYCYMLSIKSWCAFTNNRG